MQLVVQRARALHHGDVLRDVRQAVAVLRVVKALREALGQIGHVRTVHRDQATCEQGAQYLLEMVL